MERTLPGSPEQAGPRESTRPNRKATARHSNSTNHHGRGQEILKSLKNGKAPGCGNILPEAWKEGGMVLAKVFHLPLNKIWNEEDIPQDWKLGLLVKLPKKGDLCLRKNWGGIMHLPAASKVLCKVILERMRDAFEGRLRDEQA